MPRFWPEVECLAWFAYIVAPMTRHTFGSIIAQLGMGTLQIVVLRRAMTATANVGHLLETRRRCTVGAMAGCAVWCSEILVVDQGVAVDALPVERELIGWDVIRRHQGLV